MSDKFEHKKIDAKWQKKWEESGIYKTDLDGVKDPYYNLMMFPYPSAEGLHVGNMYAFTGSDIWGRYQRLRGKDVFEPIGLDGFGIHSENYAFKIKEHIREVSKRTEKHFYEQLRMTGNQYDWSRTVETYDKDYYKWTQWLFIQMYKNGLAYRKGSQVNWCPSCKTVLSDEQVVDGKCERCNSETTMKNMEQWFFKITEYAERLLNNLKTMDWSTDVKVGQANWIGRKEGINIEYEVEGADQTITCFTTRPDTNFGATFIVLAPDGEVMKQILDDCPNKEEVIKYIEKTTKKTELERQQEEKNKTGVFTGLYAINNLNGKKLPIYVSDFVLASFGTGAVIGVPGHDVRDFEFAKAMDIEVIRVVVGSDGDDSPITKVEQVQEEAGKMINSEFLNGMDIKVAIEKMKNHLEKKGWGKRVVSYKLRDWVVSRQRYWGPPIPMIHCDKCGWNPVPEKDLPVELPDIPEYDDIVPDGSGKSPLARLEDFVSTKCPHCGGEARRETDVLDPFVDSCWYFLRYPSTEFMDVPFDRDRTKKWLPVKMYIGGKEHTVLHLLYARFVTMALNDWRFIDFEEPFSTFFGNGLLIKEGAKMSKSKGNVVNPDEFIGKYGADAVRMYLMFLGDFGQGGDWQDRGMAGMYKFITRIYKICTSCIEAINTKGIKVISGERNFIHSTIKNVTNDLERLSFNTAIAHLMTFFNNRGSQDGWGPKIGTDGKFETSDNSEIVIDIESLEKFLVILAPFAPHITEELWEMLGKKDSIHKESWPEYDEEMVKDEFITMAVQINGKVREKIEIATGSDQKAVEKEVMKSEKVKKYLGSKPKKVIFVKDRIINFIV